MQKEEARLREKIAALLTAAEAADSEEDARYGRDRGDELPTELARAQGRRERIRGALRELEAEAQTFPAQEQRSDSDDEPPPSGSSPLPSHKVPTTADGRPTDKAQRNFTDEDSRIMKAGDGFTQGYNAQCVVDANHQIIVAQAVTNQPPDVEHFVPMMEQVRDNCGIWPTMTSADAGYFSEKNIVWAENQGLDPHVATGRRRHDELPPRPIGRAPKDLTLKGLMARKLATKAGARVYARRKVIAEPPFGQIKNRGFRAFLLRGLAKVRGEWALITASHNLLKLYRSQVA
jgi:hypothetical protein